MSFTIAIVGRPNVGKSTLFNRLVGRRLALVDDRPGVTRDRREGEARLGDLSFKVIDTAGLEDAERQTLSARMQAQTAMALAQADAVLFVVDAREAATPIDRVFADLIRRSGKPNILVANKSEGRAGELGALEAYALGLGEPVAISAEHGEGLAVLYDALRAALPAATEQGEAAHAVEPSAEAKPIRIAVVGRPNTGKSTLINRLIGEERLLTGPEAGITRDAIAARWEADGREILLHDTAGLRKKARVAGNTLEEMSVGSTLEAVQFADCVVVVIDALQAFEKQDLIIADLIEREGRAVVFAINKYDLAPNRAGLISKMREKLDACLPQCAGAPLIATSATTGEGLERLLPAVLAADKAWNTRIPTATLNRYLSEALQRHAPPAISGRRVKIRYMTQAKSRPPTFALFGNQLKALPEAYIRYLLNGLRQTFHLEGTPLRVVLRGSKNPFAKD